jgi:PAS domain S-box-containing protein
MTIPLQVGASDAIETMRGRCRVASATAAAVVLLIGSAGLVGWILHVRLLQSIGPGLATMKVNTAISLLLSGVALWFCSRGPTSHLSNICALAVILVAAASLLEWAGAPDLGIDQLLFLDRDSAAAHAPPGRMSPATAVELILVGVTLALLDTRAPEVAPYTALATAFAALVALTGYFYGPAGLYSAAPFASMALPTAICFLLLGLGLLLVRPERRLVAVALGEGMGPALVRRLLPAVIGIPLLTGWLRLAGERAGFYRAEFGVTLLVVTNVAVLGLMVAWTAQRVSTAEETVERASERFRRIVEAAPSAMLSVDTKGQIALANRNAEVLFGYSREEIVGQPIESLLPQRFRAAHAGYVQSFFRDPQARPMGAGRDLFARRKDGTKVPVEIGLSPMDTPEGAFTLASIIDITERLETAALQQRLAAIVESSQDAIVSKTLDSVVTSWNRGAEHLLGYTAAEAIGHSIRMVVPERLFHEEAEFIERIKANESINHYETARVRKDGREVSVSVTLSPIRNASGEIVGASSIARDITARKRAEDELRRSNAELEQFAYVASHDLQEPLRMVANYTELLGNRYKGRLDEKADKYIFYAVDGAKRMQRLVSDLLAYSRVGSQGKEPTRVDSGVVLRRVVQSLEGLIREAGATVAFGALPTVLADEVQLQQLLQNLVGNAIKFRSAEAPRVEVRAILDGARWTFSVSDNGTGFEMRYADRVFQMFQRLHERGKYEGSGIGLAIARRIVERHGGRIWVESASGAGTTFFFTLPAASQGEP